ncbi:hypothetical protein BOW53_03535 [Solemya pervernicosa gill symbiont]|uniref:Acyltransferase 3 domain-containing protein n=1 Tax=Solemya pervernicosa gill symbiont TaxID=642797 RepID=A0A1T2L8L1_9GAMM|nr:acyltransferase [Solemya pervernicosa gill symbiont]OOZ41458.1 hypothetical protein BOW53_03535 [Solemya pervernicosa gill symbiont]
MLAYRKEIDGLRAIAVMAVFFHHLGLQLFSGGYVGVDVFFVISGYVIFRSILNELNENTFSVRLFYERRIRRTLPPLILVILLCLVAGLWILTPKEYIEMSKSAIAALFSVSNFYFNDNAGNYFSAAANTIPLLHTWSLGVEEQFYLLVPLLFLKPKKVGVLSRVRNTLLIVIALTFSYNLYEIYYRGGLHDAFYLPIARFWEISIGGLLALTESHWNSKSFPLKSYLVD